MQRSTLPELRDAALRECPEAFQLVSDISTFTFERRIACPAYGRTRQEVVLHLAYLRTRESEERVYAFINPVNSKVSFLSELPEKGDLFPLVFTLIPDPNVVRGLITRFVTPFDLAVEHPLSRSREDQGGGAARKQMRLRAVLLAQWAFLLTGRIGYIEHKDVMKDDILREFVSLCVHIHRQSKLAAEKALQAEASQVTNKNGKPAPGNVTDSQLEGPKQRDSHVDTLSKRASKRRTSAAFDSDSDAGSNKPTTTQGTNTPTTSQPHH